MKTIEINFGGSFFDRHPEIDGKDPRFEVYLKKSFEREGFDLRIVRYRRHGEGGSIFVGESGLAQPSLIDDRNPEHKYHDTIDAAISRAIEWYWDDINSSILNFV